MTRKKVKLAYISNDSSRKATFKKRKKGLMKKVHELSTLCGITACAIIYSPYDANPEVWPSNSGVQRVVTEFKTLPEMDQHKKMVDQESFLRQRIAKAAEHLKRQRKDNRELEMTEVMYQCLVGNMGMFNLNIVDLNDLGFLIDQYLKDVNRRIEILKNSNTEIGQSSNAALTATIHEVGSSSSSAAAAAYFNSIHQQQQFRQQTGPNLGLYEPQNLNLNENHNQNQLFMDMMNHPEQMGYTAEQMSFPFMDDSQHQRNHQYQHQPQQEEQIHEDSSTVQGVDSSRSIVPVTSSNTWFP